MRYPVFIINLDRQTERLRFMQNQLKTLGLESTRFPAVNGRDPAARAHAKTTWYAPLSPGEVGCFESHRGVWKRILDEGVSGAFVLEDDVVVASDFAELDFPPELLESADIIKLDQSRPKESYYGTRQVPVAPNRSVVRMLGTEMSTGAYFITRSGAAKLYERAKRYIIPVDVFMFDQMAKSFWDLRVWKLCDAAVAQLHMVSEQLELPAEFRDRIQGAPRPEQERSLFGRVRHLRLQLRRVTDGETRRQRVARAKAMLAAFAGGEEVEKRQIKYSTADDHHYREELSALSK